MFAHNYLEAEDKLGDENFKLPISFFYGDDDWVDKRPAYRILEKKQCKQSDIYLIEKADHHMYMDNPEDFINKMIKDLC